MCTPSEKQTWSPIAILGSKFWERYDVTASSQKFRSTKIPLPNEMFLPPIIRHPGPRCKPGASSERLITKLLILVHDRLVISSVAMQNGLARKRLEMAIATLLPDTGASASTQLNHSLSEELGHPEAGSFPRKLTSPQNSSVSHLTTQRTVPYDPLHGISDFLHGSRVHE